VTLNISLPSIAKDREVLEVYLYKDSPVGMATRYGLHGLGIKSLWEARFSAPVQTDPGAHPVSYTMSTVSFAGIKRPERGVDHPPHLGSRLKKG
jgi:hypothetical protein